MKINENFALHQVAGKWVVLPLAEATLDFNGMITLNETGVLLWNQLIKGSDRNALAKALTEEYDVSAEQALEDVDAFLNKLTQLGCLDQIP